MEQKPSVGRIVHYQSYGTPGGEFKSEPRAAVVTGVYPAPPTEPGSGSTVGEFHADLCVLNPTGLFFNRIVPYSAEGKPGTWCWPPRV